VAAVLAGLAPAAPMAQATSSSPRAQTHGPAVTCPRCGYRCDGEWRYCVRCGWDLQTLVGQEAALRLQLIGQTVFGATVVRRDPGLDEILPPKLLWQTHYIGYRAGLHKNFTTAFPFLRPGLFVTNARSLIWGETVTLRSYNNRTFAAEILGYDVASGVGLLKADIPGVEPLKPAQEGPVPPSAAWSICYPVTSDGGTVSYLPQSLHHGRITAVGETGTHLASFENLLRSDHSVPDGCLGGPLMDVRGAVAGMILGAPEPGLVYGVPAADLAAVVEALAKKTLPQRPYFGLGLVMADERRRAKFGLSGNLSHPLVAYLIPGSPAAAAGVLPGDLLTRVGESEVADVAEAGGELLKASPGSESRLVLERGGKKVEVTVVAGKRPPRVLLAPTDELQEDLEANLTEVTAGSRSQPGLRLSDLVRGGRGELDGYRNGDVIFQVNGKGVRKLETFDELIRMANPHIFAGAVDESATAPRYSTCYAELEVRPEGKDKEARDYLNVFPDRLSAPVY